MGNATLRECAPAHRAPALTPAAELALARRAADGDREAFRSIFEANQQRMFSVARTIIDDPGLAEDVVQEAFIKAYRALPRFRGEARLSTWLHRITWLAAIDMQRRGRHLRQLSDELQEERMVDGDPGRGAERELETKRLQERLRRALQRLSEMERMVFVLRHTRNFKLREIAAILERSEGTIKNVLFRALRKMREQLEDTGPPCRSGKSTPAADNRNHRTLFGPVSTAAGNNLQEPIEQ